MAYPYNYKPTPSVLDAFVSMDTTEIQRMIDSAYIPARDSLVKWGVGNVWEGDPCGAFSLHQIRDLQKEYAQQVLSPDRVSVVCRRFSVQIDIILIIGRNLMEWIIGQAPFGGRNCYTIDGSYRDEKTDDALLHLAGIVTAMQAVNEAFARYGAPTISVSNQLQIVCRACNTAMRAARPLPTWFYLIEKLKDQSKHTKEAKARAAKHSKAPADFLARVATDKKTKKTSKAAWAVRIAAASNPNLPDYASLELLQGKDQELKQAAEAAFAAAFFAD